VSRMLTKLILVRRLRAEQQVSELKAANKEAKTAARQAKAAAKAGAGQPVEAKAGPESEAARKGKSKSKLKAKAKASTSEAKADAAAGAGELSEANADEQTPSSKPNSKSRAQAKQRSKPKSSAKGQAEGKSRKRKRDHGSDSESEGEPEDDADLAEILGLRASPVSAPAASNSAVPVNNSVQTTAEAESKRSTKARRVSESKMDARPQTQSADAGTADECCVKCREAPSVADSVCCAGCARVWCKKCGLTVAQKKVADYLQHNVWFCRACKRPVVPVDG